MRASPEPGSFLPLSPQVLHVLLSLVDGPLHGYAMIVDIARRTDGEMRLTASTLYDALSRLVDQTLIEKTLATGSRSQDSRRRYYKLTALGREVAEAEMRRMSRLLAIAREKKLLRR
jgi:DNA-binding PadR family transcriptional regulator